MKHLKILSLILIAGFVVFSTSCKKEEPSGPTLSVSADKSTAWKSDEIKFTYTVSSNADLEKLSYTTSASNLVPGDEVTLSGTSVSDTIKVTLPSAGLTSGDDIIFTFEAIDKDGEDYAATKTVTITLEEPASQYGNITSYTSKVLGSYNATVGSSFASADGTVYSWSDATSNSSLIDWVYYYGATNEATIAAPNDADANTVFDFSGWNTKNETKFGTTSYTATEFDDMTNDELIVENSNSVSSTDASKLSVNEVIAFETVGGKKGLIKITNINTGSDGDITISVKMQE